jgi:hypothetical protein
MDAIKIFEKWMDRRGKYVLDKCAFDDENEMDVLRLSKCTEAVVEVVERFESFSRDVLSDVFQSLQRHSQSRYVAPLPSLLAHTVADSESEIEIESDTSDESAYNAEWERSHQKDIKDRKRSKKFFSLEIGEQTDLLIDSLTDSGFARHFAKFNLAFLRDETNYFCCDLFFNDDVCALVSDFVKAHQRHVKQETVKELLSFLTTFHELPPLPFPNMVWLFMVQQFGGVEEVGLSHFQCDDLKPFDNRFTSIDFSLISVLDAMVDEDE